MRKEKLPYREPKIIRCKSGDWYIQYYFEMPDEPGKWKAFKERCGINRYSGAEKEYEAELLRKQLFNWLKEGNSPFHAKKEATQQAIVQILQKEQQIEKASKKHWSLGQAIANFNQFIETFGYAQRTIETYKTNLNILADIFTNAELLDKIAWAFSELDFLPLLNKYAFEHEWSARTFNNQRDFSGTFFNRCEKLEKVIHRSVKYEFNVDNLDPRLTRPQVNKPFTPAIKELIKKECIKLGFLMLKDYCEWIYISSMRPDEIRNLKIIDIDMSSRQIRIMGKTGDRLVPISHQLEDLMKRRRLFDRPVGDYVFGKKGFPDEARMGETYFLDQFDIIRTNLKLPPEYKIYSFKPTGIIAMINAGFDDKEIMKVTGHKTQKAFDLYKRDLIIENTHVMKGSTIDF